MDCPTPVVVERSTRARAPTWPAIPDPRKTRALGDGRHFAGPPLPEAKLEDTDEPTAPRPVDERRERLVIVSPLASSTLTRSPDGRARRRCR